MIIQSKYAKIFHSKDLTRQKYDELHDFAVLIQNHKNTVSQYVNDNLLYFLEYNKFQFIKEMRERRGALFMVKMINIPRTGKKPSERT